MKKRKLKIFEFWIKTCRIFCLPHTNRLIYIPRCTYYSLNWVGYLQLFTKTVNEVFLHKIFFENFNCRAFYKFNLFGIDCSASSKRNYSDSSSYRCILHNVKALLEGENSWCNQFSMFNERRRFSVKRENMVAEIAENRYIYWHNGTASLSLEYLPSCPSLFLHKDNFLLNIYYIKESGKIQCFYY